MDLLLNAPIPIEETHDLSQLDSGIQSLNDWLQKRALKNEKIRASRTFVICHKNQVIGYYSLASASIAHEQATSKTKRNMPDPIPAVLLGRLAVDQTYQGKGLGSALLQDALKRIVKNAQAVAIKAVLVHALDKKAAEFYISHGFHPSPLNEYTLMLTVDEIINCLE